MQTPPSCYYQNRWCWCAHYTTSQPASSEGQIINVQAFQVTWPQSQLLNSALVALVFKEQCGYVPKVFIYIHWSLNFISYSHVKYYPSDFFSILKIVKIILSHGLYKNRLGARFSFSDYSLLTLLQAKRTSEDRNYFVSTMSWGSPPQGSWAPWNRKNWRVMWRI